MDLIEGTDILRGDFARDVVSSPDASVPGRYHGKFTDAWKVFYVFGGFSMATALKAVEQALGRPELAPISATAVFAAPIPTGSFTVDVEVLRSGRKAAQARASLRSTAGGRETGTDLHLTAIFGAPEESPHSFVETVFPPDARPPEVCEEPPPPPEDSPFPTISYHHQTDFRSVLPGLFGRDEWQEGPARSLTWHRLIDEPRLGDGTIDPVSHCIPADIVGPALFARLGPSAPDRPPVIDISLEISLQLMAPTTSPWLLQHASIPHCGDGFTYGTVELWDPEGTLVGIATQRASLRPFNPAVVEST